MDLRISQLSNPFRIFLDAPYQDGYENIKASLCPSDPRITFSKITITERITQLSQRFIQFGIGLILLIPVINIVAALTLRFFFPDPTQRREQQLTQPLSSTEETSVSNHTILHKILPRVMNFLDENGMRGSHIELSDNTDPLSTKEFTVTLNETNTFTVPIPVYQNSEEGVFTQLKTAITDSGFFQTNPVF